ncbi:trace amine-associated receptor 7c-like [Epinephelus moara]|uniref:trace amine-associated receptor 7c-like n=1 Tax=Epinephelus moara TaxID=300413 RepID=UPI00214F280F|nr:trace amine-associated receptor 7c-like [Epinephelus moara]
MDSTEGPLLCFPNLNSSCRRLLRPGSDTALLYTLLAFVSLLTVTLNLLVIISISHFRQLHTLTNTLLLSLAVSDLVVGLLGMPIEGLRYMETTAATAGTAAPTAKKSERKAARTLGIVIAVFLLCFCPYYYPALAGEDTSTSLSYFAVLSWISLLNSCANPLIYALFYPWFRKAIKLIFTLKILQPHSREIKIL